MNCRAFRFQHTMLRLALVAMALMLCMPVLSRWQAMVHAAPADALGMCLSGDAHTHHPPADNGAPPEHQHNHDACGYCTLATRMLPVLALVVVIPPPPPIRYRQQRALPAPPAAPDWPAHHPRGSPFYA